MQPGNYFAAITYWLLIHVVCSRLDYTRDKIDWADIVMSTGGDGTFLLAASMIQNNRKPVIGFNSVPERSEGYLCLPKNFSDDITGAVEQLQGVSNNYIMYLYCKLLTYTSAKTKAYCSAS